MGCKLSYSGVDALRFRRCLHFEEIDSLACQYGQINSPILESFSRAIKSVADRPHDRAVVTVGNGFSPTPELSLTTELIEILSEPARQGSGITRRSLMFISRTLRAPRLDDLHSSPNFRRELIDFAGKSRGSKLTEEEEFSSAPTCFSLPHCRGHFAKKVGLCDVAMITRYDAAMRQYDAIRGRIPEEGSTPRARKANHRKIELYVYSERSVVAWIAVAENAS